MIKVIKSIFFTLLFIIGITFSMENTDLVILKFYFGFETPPVPVFLLVLFAILLGVLLAGFSFLIDERLLVKQLKEKDNEIENLKGEFHNPLEGRGGEF